MTARKIRFARRAIWMAFVGVSFLISFAVFDTEQFKPKRLPTAQTGLTESKTSIASQPLEILFGKEQPKSSPEKKREGVGKENLDPEGVTVEKEQATPPPLGNENKDTGFRQVQKHHLKVCVPRKVASSAHGHVREAWDRLPLAHPPKYNTSVSFALIRDPLERLWSGFWNKCLHQIEREKGQCPKFPKARQHPPDFGTWLEAQYKDNARQFNNNPHFLAMSHQCGRQLDQYQQVFHMSSPHFNLNVSTTWQRLGVPQPVAEKHYPVVKPRSLQSYHSDSAKEAPSHYNCSSLKLALPLLEADYRGLNRHYFPVPQWARDLLQECAISVEELPTLPPYVRPTKQRPKKRPTTSSLTRTRRPSSTKPKRPTWQGNFRKRGDQAGSQETRGALTGQS